MPVAGGGFPDGDGGDVVGDPGAAGGDPAVPGVELVQAGESLHASVLGQCPPGPARVGQRDGERRGDPRDITLLGEADVGALVVRVVDPPDGGPEEVTSPFDHV